MNCLFKIYLFAFLIKYSISNIFKSINSNLTTNDKINCLNTPLLCSPKAVCEQLPISAFLSNSSNNEIDIKYIAKCVCKNDFTGDGILCIPKSQCTNDFDCGLYSQCKVELLNDNQQDNLIDNFLNTRKCTCIPGYVKVAKLGCIKESEAPCNIVSNCHEKASCKFNILNRKYECDCNANYKGDGKNCEPFNQQCNILNNCDQKAKCVFNYYIREYQCECQPGYLGDGYYCRPKNSCNHNLTLCDKNANCLFNYQLNDHQCVCSSKYFGDGFNCILLPHHGEEHLIFAQGMSLLSLPLDNINKGKLLLTKPSQTFVGLDIDCLKGQVYWTDIGNKAIHRAYYNSSYLETIIQGQNDSPEGIAIDWISRNIYWTDSKRDVIEVMKLEGNEQKILINNNLFDPRGIAVHPGIGKMYWTDWNRDHPKIEQANMDGTARQIMVSGSLSLPNMLAIDYQQNDLCWTDAGLKRIECIKLNGLERRILYTPANYPFDLTISQQYLYWTDWHTNKIYRVHKNGGISEKMNLPLGGHGKLYGITTALSHCIQMSNPCAIKNGQCKHMCLPNSVGGRICTCPDKTEEGDECSNK